jgi:hypothetical protein
MVISLLDLLSFGSDRAIANAGREMRRRRTEARRIEELVDALARHEAPGCQSQPATQRRRRGEGPATRTCGDATTYATTGQLRPWRLDYTIRDEPDALAAAAQGLRGLGVAVGTCDVRPLGVREAAVVGTIALPPWLDVPAVEYVLRCAGADDVRAVPIRCAPGTPPAEGHRP